MPAPMPKKIRENQSYELFLDEMDQVRERLSSVKKGTVAYTDLKKHYLRLCREKADYIRYQKLALARGHKK